jgi:putative membrane protein
MRTLKIVIVALAIAHAVGVVGIAISINRPELFALAWVFLLVSMAALLLFQQSYSWYQLPVAFAIAVIGFVAEVVGVKTGLLFGDYSYGASLGIKMFDVPLIIGLNWLMLVYCSRAIVERYFSSALFRVVVGALLMVAYDFLVEIPAGRLDMWSWRDGAPGVENFIGWFGVATVMHIIVEVTDFRFRNWLAMPLFFIQFVFFGLLTALFFII